MAWHANVGQSVPGIGGAKFAGIPQRRKTYFLCTDWAGLLLRRPRIAKILQFDDASVWTYGSPHEPVIRVVLVIKITRNHARRVDGHGVGSAARAWGIDCGIDAATAAREAVILIVHVSVATYDPTRRVDGVGFSTLTGGRARVRVIQLGNGAVGSSQKAVIHIAIVPGVPHNRLTIIR